MFDTIKQSLNAILEEEIERVRQSVINKDTYRKGRNTSGIEFLDSKNIKDVYETCLGHDTMKILLKEPHFQYKVLHDPDYPEDGYVTVMCWLSDDLNRGLVGSFHEEDGEGEISNFKVHKIGKYGRGVKCSALWDNNKNFLTHYDDFIAEIVLLGLDETSTESKEL